MREYTYTKHYLSIPLYNNVYVYDGIHMNKIQQIQVVNTNVSICEENGHDFETVRIIDTEIVDGTKYEVVLIECLECGEEETRLGDEIEIEWEEVV